MWMNWLGNSSITSVSTSCRNAIVSSVGLKMSAADPPARPRLERFVRIAAELRVGGDGRAGVAGHLDLGHDVDVPVGRVANDLADVVLRVEAAVLPAVELPGLRRGRGRRVSRPARRRPR